MKLSLILLLLTTLSTSVFSSELRSISHDITMDLSGPLGFDGVDGEDGLALDCSQFEMIMNGNDGLPGRDGEVGGRGEDLYAFIDNASSLKKLTLDQSGGNAGSGGVGGRGSNGCNGGLRGLDGHKGQSGEDGAMGKFYLLPQNFVIPKTNPTKILSLTQLSEEKIVLSENTWNENEGLKSLLNSSSKVADTYYTFKQTKSFEVKLVWNTNQFVSRFEDTKFALSVHNGKLDLRSYTGGFLEYTILPTSYGFDVIIHKVIAEHTVQSLKLKRIKYSGIDLTLEVRQGFNPRIDVKTRFVISFQRIENSIAVEKTGFIEISKNLVHKSYDRYFLTIGRLRIPESFKKKGTKLRVLLTVYREVQGQTRARGLDGIFKI